jgi:glycosyltransferase involved in cell wall biosynthesis
VANAPGLAVRSMRADPVPVQVIPNGVDTEFFRPAVDAPTASDDEPLRFLAVGRLTEQKNLGFALDAMKRLRSRTTRPFLLEVVGDGPSRTELVGQAAGLGIGERILWHPWCDQTRLRAMYQNAHCFLNPSLYEGMPNTVLEAMACALPVIASDIEGNRDLVRDGETGILVPLGDVGRLSEALYAAMRSPQRSRAMGVEGRRRVAGQFSWGRSARRYAALLASAASEARGA